MNFKIRLREEAEADLDEATSWYEDRRNGLGTEFLDAVSGVFAEISANPQRFPIVYRRTRRALLPRFPYGISYRVRDSTVDVLAVFHASRVVIRVYGKFGHNKANQSDHAPFAALDGT